jgi:hypothetical protein
MRYLDEAPRNMNGSEARFAPHTGRIGVNDWRGPALPAADPAVLGRWTRRIVIATAVWSVFELPFEVWVSRSPQEALACIVGKVLWVALVCFALGGSRVARIAYAFLCTIGLMAMAFALPLEYRAFPLGFALTSVECVLKAAAFVCLVSVGVYPDEE